MEQQQPSWRHLRYVVLYVYSQTNLIFRYWKKAISNSFPVENDELRTDYIYMDGLKKRVDAVIVILKFIKNTFEVFHYFFT